MGRTRKKNHSWDSIPSADNDICANIDTDAIQHNLAFFTKQAGTEIMPVLKANAYGHGLVPIAQFLRKKGVRYLGVATLGEAILLRHRGDKGRILSWLYDIHGKEVHDALAMDLDMTLFYETHLPMLTRMIPKGRTVRITVFVDTGIHRAGIPYEHAEQLCHTIAADPRFELVGLMSHLVCSEKKNNRVVHQQLRRFRALRDQLAHDGIHPPLIHIANSEACLHYDVSDFTLSRVGSGLYGFCTSPHLRLAMSLTAPIIQLTSIEKGDGVGYNWNFIAPRAMRIAIVPIGYADVLTRSHHVFLHGTKRKVLGKWNMDQIVIEARPTDRLGDTVFLFGNGQRGVPTIMDLAKEGKTTPLEIASHLGYRIYRNYSTYSLSR